MKTRLDPFRNEMTWLRGRSFPPEKAALKYFQARLDFKARLVVLPILVIVGVATWMTLAVPSDAGSQPPAQNASWFNPAITPTEASLAVPADTDTDVNAPAAAAPVETAPVDGLRISSQSWRRGGLGSNALVTLTLRNGNNYAVRDIEISCAFIRRDGSHLTDRTRMIHDTVAMKGRRTFARLHVGFVNVYADRAKCSLVSAAPAASGQAVTKR